MFRTALAFIASIAMAGSAVAAGQASTATMWFADRHATAYYQLDEATGDVVTIVQPGPNSGNAVETRRRLAEGDTTSMTLRGSDTNAIAVTLTIMRQSQVLRPSIETRVLDDATN
jgi:hypothetical protein